MKLPLASALLLLAGTAFAAAAAPQALVFEATWDRFSQHTDLRYTHLGTRTRLESTATDKPDPYLLVDTAQDQRITVYRHNSSWRLDPLEPKPRSNSPMGAPGIPAMPQPPPGIGPQGPIGPRTGPGAGNTPAMPPTPGYGSPAGHGPSIPQSTIRDPQSPAPAGLGPQGPIGPRTGLGATAPNQPAVPARPEMPAMPQRPAGVSPQGGMGPAAGGMSAMPGAGMGAGFGGGIPMPPPSAMPGREQQLTLTKTEETQTLLGRTAVKHTLTGRMMETIEIWAVPEADFGAFVAYRPQPPHRFGPVDLQDEWDSLLRREHLFPLLAVFKQAEREVARFSVTTIETRKVGEPAVFFAPPANFFRCPPDPF